MKVSNRNFMGLSAVWLSAVVLIACEAKTDTNTAGSISVTPVVESSKKISTVTLFPNSSDIEIVASKGHNYETSAKGLSIVSNFDRPQNAGGSTQGISFVLPKNIEKKLRGQEVTVKIITGQIEGDDIDHNFQVAYSTNMNGNSGWNIFTSEAGKTHSFSYLVPATENDTGYNFDYLGIISDSNGLGRPLLVKSVQITY